MTFVTAVNAHGKKQRVPEHWLDHPTIGKGFRLSPKAKAVQAEAERSDAPDDSWTVADLKAYADAHEIDLAGATLKADIVSAIQSA